MTGCSSSLSEPVASECVVQLRIAGVALALGLLVTCLLVACRPDQWPAAVAVGSGFPSVLLLAIGMGLGSNRE